MSQLKIVVLAAKLFLIRQRMKAHLGDKFKTEVEPYKLVVIQRMHDTGGESEINAVKELLEEIKGEPNEAYEGGLLVSAALELIEPLA